MNRPCRRRSRTTPFARARSSAARCSSSALSGSERPEMNDSATAAAALGMATGTAASSIVSAARRRTH